MPLPRPVPLCVEVSFEPPRVNPPFRSLAFSTPCPIYTVLPRIPGGLLRKGEAVVVEEAGTRRAEEHLASRRQP